MTERQATALWLRMFNQQWKQEQSTNDIWQHLERWQSGQCNICEHAKQDDNKRKENTLTLFEALPYDN